MSKYTPETIEKKTQLLGQFQRLVDSRGYRHPSGQVKLDELSQAVAKPVSTLSSWLTGAHLPGPDIYAVIDILKALPCVVRKPKKPVVSEGDRAAAEVAGRVLDPAVTAALEAGLDPAPAVRVEVEPVAGMASEMAAAEKIVATLHPFNVEARGRILQLAAAYLPTNPHA